MRFWGFLALTPGMTIAIGGFAVALSALLDLITGWTEDGFLVEAALSDLQVGLAVIVGGLILASPGIWLWTRHMHDPSSIQIWLQEVQDDPEIRPQLDELDEQFSQGELSVIGYEADRNHLRFKTQRT